MFVSDAAEGLGGPLEAGLDAGGQPELGAARSIARTASPSEAPGARLKDTVTTGNCPWWLTESGVLDVWTRVKAPSGTGPPPADRR